jgi:CHASE1-domain containing sensor protein
MFGRGLPAGVVAAILVVGLSTTAILFVQAERIAERQEAALSTRAGRALQTVSGNVVSSFGGASAVVDASGAVAEIIFDSYASGVVDTTLLPVLAYVETVADADRAAFERDLGRPINAATPDGLAPSPAKDEYLVVRYVYPLLETSKSVIGFDIASDPVRAEAAEAAVTAGSTVFSAPITSQPSGQMAVFAIKPLYRPGMALATADDRRAAFVGFISSLVPAKTMLATISTQLPAAARVSISDHGRLLTSTPVAPRGGHDAEVDETGREWTISVEYHDADLSAAWSSLVATLLLATAVGVSLWRNRRQTAQLRTAAHGMRQLGELSERLAVADTRDDVLRIILPAAGASVRATTVSLAFPSPDGTKLLVTRVTRNDDGQEPDPEGAPERLEMLAAEPSPITDAWNTKTAVVVRDEAAFRGLYDGDGQERATRHVGSSAALPLRRPTGEMIGVLAWEWPTANRFAESLRSTLQASADLVQQSVHRADQHEQRWTAASALLTLSQRLSIARTTRQIADAVLDAGADAASADHVGVGFLNETGTAFDLYHPAFSQVTHLPISTNGPLMSVLRRGQPIEFYDRTQIERFPELAQLVASDMERLVCIPLVDSGGHLRGVLAFVFSSGSSNRRRPDAGRLATIADVTAQTVERAMLYLHEHELVVNLQRQTLADLPEVEGLDIAARYLPSSATLGLGGDWYDVYVLDDGRIGAVVGDVSGHGIDAIADMTEFRTTISTLLRTNPELGQISSLSSALLRDDASDDVRFATAGLMIIDRVAGTLAYVRAGHPPMFVVQPDGEIVVLEAGGGGPIGMASESVLVQTVGIETGSVIVAYTDGLIERREESIDTGLARLSDALRECDGLSAEAIADHVIERCLGDRQTADDAALLVIVLRP